MEQSEHFLPVLNDWIAVFMHRSMQNLNRFSKEKGYSMSQIFALNFIHHHGTCGVSDLGEGMSVSNAAASQLLEKLVQQQMIERTEDPEDRRGKQIRLTNKGDQIIRDSLFARQSWLSELESRLSSQEKEQAISVLHLLIEKGRQIEFSKNSEYSSKTLNL